MNKKDNTLNIILLTALEALVSLVVVGVFLLGDLLFESDFWNFSYRVITGAALGAAVTVLNYVFLTISLNRQVAKFIALRGNAEMSPEEAVAFAAKNAVGIQNAIKISFLVRTASIVITLVIAFLLEWFAPLATVIPLLAFRPLLTLIELVKRKIFKTPDPMALMNAINYASSETDTVEGEFTDITEDSDEENSEPSEENTEKKESDD